MLAFLHGFSVWQRETVGFFPRAETYRDVVAHANLGSNEPALNLKSNAKKTDRESGISTFGMRFTCILWNSNSVQGKQQKLVV